MSDRRPLMPKATAVWLVNNTALTFEQIADFCGMHALEIKGIADGEVAKDMKPIDPVGNGQLTREEIKRGEGDPSHRLVLAPPKITMPAIKPKSGPRYTPVSRRQDRPNAVLWLLRSHPELKDSQIMRLVGTTKPTIQQIRERTHWNSQNLAPMDPVTLGLCTQIDLDSEVARAAKRLAKSGGGPVGHAETLKPAAETTGYQLGTHRPAEIVAKKVEEEAKPETEQDEAARVLARLKEIGSGDSARAKDEGGEGAGGSERDHDKPA